MKEIHNIAIASANTLNAGHPAKRGNEGELGGEPGMEVGERASLQPELPHKTIFGKYQINDRETFIKAIQKAYQLEAKHPRWKPDRVARKVAEELKLKNRTII